MARKLGRLFSAARSMRHKRRKSGATAVEMALIAPAFFYLLMGSVEMGLMETAQQLLENATYNTSRLAKTGYSNSGQTQAQTVTAVLNQELQSFGSLIDITQVKMTNTAYSSFAQIGTGGTNSMGTAQQIVVYTVTYPWKLFTPMIGQVVGTQDAHGNWIINLSSRIVVRNEPYSS